MRPLVLAMLSVALSAQDIGPTPIARRPHPHGQDIAQTVAAMAGDARTRALFAQRGLDVLSLTWEDTGRSKGSSVGPNISDLTIQVLGQAAGRGRSDCMPVVRYPNFADRSCDVPIDRLKLLVGNEHGSALRPVSLREYLADFARFQTRPTGRLGGALVGERDAAVLASAQACFLPVAGGGRTSFAPVLFNYQSSPQAPAVLVIMATPEGTSAQVITNAGEAASGVTWGQRLFHNRAGERAPLSATRFSDHQSGQASQGQPVAGDAATRDGLSLVLVIQVPLRVARPVREDCEAAAADAMPSAPQACAALKGRGAESAVIASGPVEGPWLGLAGHTIERDFRLPIRATVQFYQATDRAEVDQGDVARVAKAIERIYLDADAVGSLVTDGHTGRATEHHVPAWPQPWWQGPCEAYSARWNEPWPAALARVRARLGADWQPADARELRNALELAR